MAEIQNSIYCTLTNIGLQKSQEASHNNGYFIKPTTFGVSQVKGIYSSSRSSAYPMWYQSTISSHEIVDANTIAFYCDIPENAYITNNVINEIYLFAEDFEFNSFLLCLGQIDELKFIPGTSIKLKIVINILQFDLLSTYKFENSSPRDIEEHNNDPTAHYKLFTEILSRTTEVQKVDSDTVAKGGDTFYCETNKLITITLPDSRISDGDTVTIIDHSGNANENPITVNASAPIDGSTESFIINQSGGKVVFTWNSKKSMWNVDIAGRLNNPLPQGYNPNRKIYYTDYFTGGISVYNIWTDYRTGEFITHHNKLYRCIYSNNSDNIAIPGESNSWEPVAFGYGKVTIRDGVTKNTAYVVPYYIKGSDMLKVYIDGLLCNNSTYYEDPDVENNHITNRIFFFGDIPSRFLIEVIV